MRELIIIRKKGFVASLVKVDLIVDGRKVAQVKNGETIHLAVDEGEHKIFTQVGKSLGNLLQTKEGIEDIVLHMEYVKNAFTLTPEREEDVEVLVEGETIEKQATTLKYEEPDSKVPTYLSSIIIHSLIVIFGMFLYLSNQITLLAFSSSFLFAVANAILMIVGGFWILIIPLPYIFIWKAGCVKPNQSTVRKFLLGTLNVILAVLSIIVLFIL